MKMAQKRGYVGATLHAYGLSDEFTQDVEDTGVGTDAIPGDGPAKAKPPICPVHNKPMKDQRASKKNPKAPDWKCTVKTDGKWCDQVKWPGEWPPKGEGTEANGSNGAAPWTPTTLDDVDNMTLEQATALPLLGRPEQWGGNGSKPLGTLSSKLLVSARTFFISKLEEKDDVRLHGQVHAITLILEDREKDQTKMDLSAPGDDLPDPAPVSATVPAPGKVEDALKPNEPPAPSNTLTSTYGPNDDIPF